MRDSLKGIIALLLGILVFSSIEVVSKMIEVDMPPFRLAFLRFFIGGAILLPAVLRNNGNGRNLCKKDYVEFAKLGVIGVTITIGIYHLAIKYCPANVAAIIFSCNPAFVALFAPFLLGEKVSAGKIVSVGLCLAGISWIGFNFEQTGSPSFVGVILMFVSAICFAFYTVLLKKAVPNYGALTITCAAGLFGSLFLVPITLGLEGLGGWNCGITGWLGVLYLGVVATGFGYLFYFYGISHVEASLGSMTFFLKPFIAALLAWLMLGEKLSRSVLVGGVIILAGIAITIIPQIIAHRKNGVMGQD
ncbi:DMT family transporter [Verrucomicrobiota bacterium]